MIDHQCYKEVLWFSGLSWFWSLVIQQNLSLLMIIERSWQYPKPTIVWPILYKHNPMFQWIPWRSLILFEGMGYILFIVSWNDLTCLTWSTISLDQLPRHFFGSKMGFQWIHKFDCLVTVMRHIQLLYMHSDIASYPRHIPSGSISHRQTCAPKHSDWQKKGSIMMCSSMIFVKVHPLTIPDCLFLFHPFLFDKVHLWQSLQQGHRAPPRSLASQQRAPGHAASAWKSDQSDHVGPWGHDMTPWSRGRVSLGCFGSGMT